MEQDKDLLVNLHLNNAALKFIEHLDYSRFTEAAMFADQQIAQGYDEMKFYKYWATTLILIGTPLVTPTDKELILIRDLSIEANKRLTSKVDRYTGSWIVTSLESLLSNPENYSLRSNAIERINASVMNVSLAKDINPVDSFYQSFVFRLDRFSKEVSKRKDYWFGKEYVDKPLSN